MKLQLFLVLVLASIAVSCVSLSGQSSLSYELASFFENDVTVSISLDEDAGGGYFLSASFTPPEGYHLYSKDIPPAGVDGLGRPTLLELTTNSQMKSLGGLIENKIAEIPNFEPRDLLVYPPGAVTLSLPVQIPYGDRWVEDEVTVTFMACNDRGCKAPVTGRLVSLHIPDGIIISGP